MRAVDQWLVEAPIAADFSARLKWESFFQFIFDPKIELTVGDFQLMYKFGHLEPRSKLIQPPNVTVDPLPFAFKEARSLDASQIRGRVTIRGGDQFETAGDPTVSSRTQTSWTSPVAWSETFTRSRATYRSAMRCSSS